jgi:hypothetical protein
MLLLLLLRLHLHLLLLLLGQRLLGALPLGLNLGDAGPWHACNPMHLDISLHEGLRLDAHWVW